MEKLIYFFTTVPLFIFLSVPLLMILVNSFTKKEKINYTILKTWSYMTLSVAFLMSFAVYVICSQGDVAFLEGQYLLTEKMSLLFLITQGLSIIAIYGVFKFEKRDLRLGNVSSIFCSLALLNYAAYINYFYSVFVILAVMTFIEKTISFKSKAIYLGGLVITFGLYYFTLSSAGLSFNLTFEEMRLINLQEGLGRLYSSSFAMALVFIAFSMTYSKIFSKSTLSWHSSFNSIVISTSALFIVLYRLVNSGFFEKTFFIHSLAQWFLILNLLTCVFLVYSSKTLIKKFFHVINFNFTLIILSLLTLIDTYILTDSSISYLFTMLFFSTGVIYVLKTLSSIKGDEVIPYDLLSLQKSNGWLTFLLFFSLITASALPPSPVFFNLYGVFKEFMKDGLYWVTLWSAVGLGCLFVSLIPLLFNSQNVKIDKSDVYFLWKNKQAEVSFFEWVFLTLMLLFTYTFAFINL